MKIQGRDFEDGELEIYTDHSRSEHAGAGGCFQIVDILLNNNSILAKLNIDQGRHYFNLNEVAEDLEVNPNQVNITEVSDK